METNGKRNKDKDKVMEEEEEKGRKGGGYLARILKFR